MLTIAISGLKGGTGKTTTTRELAGALSERMRVLLVDADPQASLTHATLTTPPAYTLADVLDKRIDMAGAIVALGDRLAIVGADQRLSATENALRSAAGGVFTLSKTLAKLQGYDLCIIDCMPTLSQLVTGALLAADGCIVPSKPEANDIRGLPSFMALLADVQDIPGAHVELIGIVATMVRTGSTLHADGIEALRGLGPVIGQIGQTVRFSDASANLQTLSDVDANNTRVTEYQQLSNEVYKWIKRTQKRQASA